jgi:hypothetical protein
LSGPVKPIIEAFLEGEKGAGIVVVVVVVVVVVGLVSSDVGNSTSIKPVLDSKGAMSSPLNFLFVAASDNLVTRVSMDCSAFFILLCCSNCLGVLGSELHGDISKGLLGVFGPEEAGLGKFKYISCVCFVLF